MTEIKNLNATNIKQIKEQLINLVNALYFDVDKLLIEDSLKKLLTIFNIETPPLELKIQRKMTAEEIRACNGFFTRSSR